MGKGVSQDPKQKPQVFSTRKPTSGNSFRSSATFPPAKNTFAEKPCLA